MESCHKLVAAQMKGTGNSTTLSGSTVSLKRILQRSIRHLINVLPTIKKMEIDAEKHVVNLANLLEQRECVERVADVNVRLVRHRPDLRQKLMLKISSEVANEVQKLKTIILPLKELQQKLNKDRTEILSMASQHANEIDPSCLNHGSPTIPPLTTLMDFIQAAEKETRELYCSRIFYIDNLNDKSIVSSENLKNLWKQDAAKISHTTKDCQELTVYFLEEKL